MDNAKTVQFYLEEPLRKSALAGEHNFINLVSEVLNSNGLEPVFELPSKRRFNAQCLSLTHMAQPPDGKGLVFRRVYHYPFWQIDAVAQRWHWDVAQAGFDPSAAPADAKRFYRNWQKRLFGEAARAASRDGFVYVPLQGKLDQHRSFQSCSPLEMLEHCLVHEPQRQIIAALHPKERYGSAELAQLAALETKHARLTVDTGEMERYLTGCDYVVTQNSGVALSGFFFGKPALLFGEIDFHHIAERADLSNLAACFEQVAGLEPAYAEYIWWFWQSQSINAGHPSAKGKIAGRLHRFGWPVECPSENAELVPETRKGTPVRDAL